MSKEVFNLWVEVLRKLESDGPVVGLGNVAAHDRVVRRFYLKNVAAFPEWYYRRFLGPIARGDAPWLVTLMGALKHAAGGRAGPVPPGRLCPLWIGSPACGCMQIGRPALRRT